jgi:hypothetical protein
MTIALYATVWTALALFVAAEAGRNRLRHKPALARWVGPALLGGAALLVLHILIALGARYGWDHAAAVRETARQAAGVYGFEWQGNIYVSYAFVLLWLIAALRWRASRDAPHSPTTGTWIWRAFFMLVIANGAVVFATTPASRTFGAVLVLTLAWAWLPESLFVPERLDRVEPRRALRRQETGEHADRHRG